MLGVLNEAKQWASRSVQYLQSKDNHSGQSFLGFVVYWLEKTDVFSTCFFYFSLTFHKQIHAKKHQKFFSDPCKPASDNSAKRNDCSIFLGKYGPNLDAKLVVEPPSYIL